MAMADDQQQFCLRWNDFQSNMVNSFKHLRDEKSFTDVTLGNFRFKVSLELNLTSVLQPVKVRRVKPTKWFSQRAVPTSNLFSRYLISSLRSPVDAN